MRDLVEDEGVGNKLRSHLVSVIDHIAMAPAFGRWVYDWGFYFIFVAQLWVGFGFGNKFRSGVGCRVNARLKGLPGPASRVIKKTGVWRRVQGL